MHEICLNEMKDFLREEYWWESIDLNYEVKFTWGCETNKCIIELVVMSGVDPNTHTNLMNRNIRVYAAGKFCQKWRGLVRSRLLKPNKNWRDRLDDMVISVFMDAVDRSGSTGHLPTPIPMETCESDQHIFDT